MNGDADREPVVGSPADHTPTIVGRAEVRPPDGPGLPATFGHYRIVRVLGEGGMGTVYEAQQEQPRRRVALKVIKPGFSSPELLRRFELESQARRSTASRRTVRCARSGR